MAEIKVVFDAADQYERFMGRWSRAIGERFIDWLKPAPDLAWLDIGCGTGALSQLIAKRCAPRSITGVDPAPAQIEHARKNAPPKAEFRVADATALPFAEGKFDAAASALVINFIPDRARAFGEMRRVLKPGGAVAAYLWERDQKTDFSPHVPMEIGMRKLGLDPMRPPISAESTAAGAKAALEAAGFADIVTTSITAEQSYRDFDDYWETHTLAFHPIGKSIAALSEEQRTKLRELMGAALPAGPDGSITFSARALAFQARKPG